MLLQLDDVKVKFLFFVAFVVVLITIVKCARDVDAVMSPTGTTITQNRLPSKAATRAATFSYFGLSGMSNATFSRREHELFDKTIATSDSANRQRIVGRCENRGLYLGTGDLGAYDCAKACNSSNYEYTYVPRDAAYVMKFFALEKYGAYCLPTEMAKCNLRTGSIVRTATGGWACRPTWPRFAGGRYANEIRVCNGQVVDRIASPTEPRLYVNFIPDDVLPVSIESGPIDERLSSGEFRFACASEHPELAASIVDDMGNPFITTPEVSRLHQTRNVCNNLLFRGPTENAPNFLTGDCNCLSDPSIVPFGRIRTRSGTSANKTDIECSPCIFGPMKNVDADHSVFNVPRRCLKTFHYSARLAPISNSTGNRVANEDSVLFVDLLPCGTTELSTLSKSCVNALLYASKFDFPSRFAFKIIDRATNLLSLQDSVSFDDLIVKKG